MKLLNSDKRLKKTKLEIKYIIILSVIFLSLVWAELYLLQVSQSLSFSDTFFFLSLINFNIVIFLFLGFLIFKNFVNFFLNKSKIFGQSLKTKLISAFIFFSFIPTGIVAILSVFYLNNSFSKWFDYKITDAIVKVVNVGEHYQNNIRQSNYKQIYILKKKIQRQSKYWSKLNYNKKTFYINKLARNFKKENVLDKIKLHTKKDLKSFSINKSNLKNFSKLYNEGPKSIIESFVPLVLGEDFWLISAGTFISTYFLSQSKDIDEVYKVLNKESFIFTSSKLVYFSTLILMVLLIIFMATWLGFYLARQLTMPVELLSQTSYKIAKGKELDKKDLALFSSLNQYSVSKEIEQLLKDFQFMAEEIRKSKIDALKIQRVKTWAEVARRMAHEIKNPLTPISLSAQRLRKLFSATLNDQRFDQSLKMIVDNSSILKNLVNEFALYARLPENNLQKNSIMDLIKDVVLFYKNSQPEIKFNFYTECNNFTCFFDKEQLHRVLVNLIANSIEAIKTKSSPEVKIYLNIEKNNINIKLQDNGRGFKTKILHRAFEPYITDKSSGTGLGLPIVEKILKEHGGWIRAKNLKDKKGAELSLSFPIIKNLF